MRVPNLWDLPASAQRVRHAPKLLISLGKADGGSGRPVSGTIFQRLQGRPRADFCLTCRSRVTAIAPGALSVEGPDAGEDALR